MRTCSPRIAYLLARTLIPAASWTNMALIDHSIKCKETP
jgi:hypothetical protein